MYIKRDIQKQLNSLKEGFPVIVVSGPRQSGKTTLLQNSFPEYEYFNLELPQTRQLIKKDPLTFLNTHPENIIIDEIQRLPELLSYIQVHVDKTNKMGSILLSGSQNLLISEQISQSLAGRAAYLTLHPLSNEELKKANLLEENYPKQLVKGFYPALYTRNVDPYTYYNQYIATYVERDVKLIRNIEKLATFNKFLQLLAGRVGQLVNLSSLASDTGVSPNTIEDWLSILEASYIIYRLQPYYKNLGKRLIKSPKIYFYDTGLLCSILGISNEKHLTTHFALGGIFENYVIAEILKEINNLGSKTNLYFYRDNKGLEVDLLLENEAKVKPIEIKATATFNTNFFDGITKWREIQSEKLEIEDSFVVYGGKKTQDYDEETLVGWDNLEKITRQNNQR